MTITYALLVYLLPFTLACFGVLAMREYGYPCLLRMIAYAFLREADRSERSQQRHRIEVHERMERVA